MALNFSIITTCLPSMRRFLNAWASGIANHSLEEYELQVSSRHGNDPALGTLSFVESASKVMASQTKRAQRSAAEDDGYSNKGLTDGIRQTVDYHVEYEDRGK